MLSQIDVIQDFHYTLWLQDAADTEIFGRSGTACAGIGRVPD